MPICENCGNTFPSKCAIDGKLRVLSSRKYCLNCSPFGQHNTKVIHKLKEDSYLACRRVQVKTAVNNHRKRIKVKAVEYKGGKCYICGYDKCVAALEFHHIDPKTKSFSISGNGFTHSWDKIKQELDKCVLLCANCHREVENGVTRLV